MKYVVHITNSVPKNDNRYSPLGAGGTTAALQAYFVTSIITKKNECQDYSPH